MFHDHGRERTWPSTWADLLRGGGGSGLETTFLLGKPQNFHFHSFYLLKAPEKTCQCQIPFQIKGTHSIQQLEDRKTRIRRKFDDRPNCEGCGGFFLSPVDLCHSPPGRPTAGCEAVHCVRPRGSGPHAGPDLRACRCLGSKPWSKRRLPECILPKKVTKRLMCPPTN